MLDQAKPNINEYDTYAVKGKLWKKKNVNLNGEALEFVRDTSPGQFVRVLASQFKTSKLSGSKY